MDHTSVGMSVYRRKGLKERNAMFLHLQLFIEIILKMKSSNDRGKKELIQSLQQIYDGNDAQLSLVAEFERDYAPENAIWWYTRNTWLYPLLNKSLRSHDFDLLIPFQFFITDLYKQLAHEHQNFVSTVPTNSDPAFRIYRGQAIATEELNLIRESVGEFISMDSFLSTTTDRETGIAFANASVTGTEDDIKCILFELEIDTRLQNSKPFAAISHLSYFRNEEEVLIMLGCIFQIEEVKFNENLQMWMAKLIMRSADDYVLKPIFDYERKEFGNEPNLIHLARMLMNIDEYEKAKGILTQILNNSPTDLEARNCYFFLGSSARQQADYDTALINYFKCLELQQKISSPDRPSMAQTFSSMAEVYYMKEQNDLSLEYCQKALDILPDDHEYRTRVYRQAGNVYLDKAEFILALDYYKKTLGLQERTLPKDHAEIGVTYNQIGTVYKEKHDYEMALQYYEGSLTILQKTLPSSHKLIKKAESNIQTVNNLKNNANTLVTDPSS
jgi:tetratricopeptide (TPR) repeat protein